MTTAAASHRSSDRWPNDMQSHLQPQASRPEGLVDPLAFSAIDRMSEASIPSNTTGWNSGTAFPWDRATTFGSLLSGCFSWRISATVFPFTVSVLFWGICEFSLTRAWHPLLLLFVGGSQAVYRLTLALVG